MEADFACTSNDKGSCWPFAYTRSSRQQDLLLPVLKKAMHELLAAQVDQERRRVCPCCFSNFPHCTSAAGFSIFRGTEWWAVSQMIPFNHSQMRTPPVGSALSNLRGVNGLQSCWRVPKLLGSAPFRI